jgi:hypothetical protein
MAKKQLSNVTLENVRIIFKNFSGKEDKFNRQGHRNFAAILPQEVGEQMRRDGWNIKYTKPREEGDEPQPYLQVSVSFRHRPPRIVMLNGRGGRTNLDEEAVGSLDFAYIKKADLIINPSEWVFNGDTGIKAYLHALYVTIEEDELEQKYGQAFEDSQQPW